MRYLMLLALALMLCSSSALCQMNANSTASGNGLNAFELQALLVNSTASLQSYRFLMDMDQMTALVNLSDKTGASQKIASRSIGSGALNMTQRALKLVMATVIIPEGDEGNATAMALDEYLINDTIYLRLNENWTALMLPFAENVWSQQNTLEQQVEMLNGSNITLLGSETIDGEDCYKIKADIDTASLATQLSQTGSPIPLQFMNYTQLFNNAMLEAYYWITKDTHHLKRSDIFESFVIRPQDLGVEPRGPENVEMQVSANISMTYGGFNENINIELPAEAEMTEAFLLNTTLNMTTVDEAVPPASSAENATQAAL